MRTLITTVGTSVLGNFRRELPSGSSLTDLPDVTVFSQWMANSNPAKASAETNTWRGINAFDSSDTRAVLIHTDTEDGAFCAEMLASYAVSNGIQAVTVRVNGLTYDQPDHFNKGLANLARAICSAKRTAETRGYAEIVATGGFKAETAIANLIGALLNLDVHYIHEKLDRVITIQSLPVSLDIQWIRSDPVQRLLNAITVADDHCVMLSDEIRALLKQDERMQLLAESVFMAEGSMVELTVLGEIALELKSQPPLVWPSICDSDPARKVLLNTGHHHPDGWQQFLATLSRSAYVTSIRFDGAIRQQGFRNIGPVVGSNSDIGAFLDDQRSPPLQLRVTTTATDERQRHLVIGLLKKELGIR